MNYSINDVWTYVKTNWKHLLAGFIAAYVAKAYAVPGTDKASAILKILGLG